MKIPESVKAICIDCDGVLTDGTLTIDSKGEKLFKKFHTRDVRAIRELVSMGFEVYIVTADDWPGTACFAEKVGAKILVTKEKGKLFEIIKCDYIAIGDDSWDIPMFKNAVMSFCPNDSINALFKDTNITVLDAKGGCGVIAEFLFQILQK